MSNSSDLTFWSWRSGPRVSQANWWACSWSVEASRRRATPRSSAASTPGTASDRVRADALEYLQGFAMSALVVAESDGTTVDTAAQS